MICEARSNPAPAPRRALLKTSMAPRPRVPTHGAQLEALEALNALQALHGGRIATPTEALDEPSRPQRGSTSCIEAAHKCNKLPWSHCKPRIADAAELRKHKWLGLRASMPGTPCKPRTASATELNKVLWSPMQGPHCSRRGAPQSQGGAEGLDVLQPPTAPHCSCNGARQAAVEPLQAPHCSRRGAPQPQGGATMIRGV